MRGSSCSPDAALTIQEFQLAYYMRVPPSETGTMDAHKVAQYLFLLAETKRAEADAMKNSSRR